MIVAAILSGNELFRVCPTAVPCFYGQVTIAEVVVWFLGLIHRISILQDLLVGLLVWLKMSIEMEAVVFVT